MASELSKGKTLVVLAIVIGCFAILWPRIFCPMFQGPEVVSTTQPVPPKEREPADRRAGALCCGVVFESDASSLAFLSELCSQVLKRRDGALSAELLATVGRPPDRALALCRLELLDKCNIDLDDVVKSDVDGAVVLSRLQSKFHGRVRAQNLTRCLEVNFDIDENLVRAKKSYHRPIDVLYPRHMRPERPPHLSPDNVHPALREKGRVLPPLPPVRTIEKQAKPGPMPGMRPPMGGAGHMVAPAQGSGGMGILMPIYTIGIVVFFLYTMMKLMFKKPEESGNARMEYEPRIKDFHMDPEHRKYLFAEEYCSGVAGAVPEMTVKEYALLHEQQKLLLLQEQQRRSRSKTPPEVFANKQVVEEVISAPEKVIVKEEVIAEEPVVEEEVKVEEDLPEEVPEEEIESKITKMDTNGKPLEEEEVDQLRKRLEETERAMERICRQMGTVSDRLSPSMVAEMLAPALDKAASKGSSPDMDEYEVIQSSRTTEDSSSETKDS